MGAINIIPGSGLTVHPALKVPSNKPKCQPDKIRRKCNVCSRGEVEVKLVRNHCHRTGLLRKRLCEQCNSFLGQLENGRVRASHSQSRLIGTKRARRWAEKYWIQIQGHLQGKLASCHPSAPLEAAKRLCSEKCPHCGQNCCRVVFRGREKHTGRHITSPSLGHNLGHSWKA